MKLINQNQVDLINISTIEIIDGIEKDLTKDDNWGLIHGDLNEGNYITHNKALSLIDFSLCGYGYYLYNMAQTLMHLDINNRNKFINAYQEVRTLPNDYEKYLEYFFILSVIDNIIFLSNNPEEYEFIGKLVNYLSNYLLVKYKNEERFVLCT